MKFKLFALMFVVILLVGTVSAFSFDNVIMEKNINPNTGYKNLEIKNCALWAGTCLIQGETLFEGKLQEHTTSCGNNCYSKMEIAHDGGVLIDDIEFRTIQDDGSYIVQPIRSFKFEYETEDGFEEYIVGEEIPEGNYELYLRGEKKPTRTVDWVIKLQGRWLEEWAVWGGIGVLNSSLGEISTETTHIFENLTFTDNYVYYYQTDLKRTGGGQL